MFVSSNFPQLEEDIMASLVLLSDFGDQQKKYETLFKDLSSEQLRNAYKHVDAVISHRDKVDDFNFTEYLSTPKRFHKKRQRVLDAVESIEDDVVDEVLKREELLLEGGIKLHQVIKAVSKKDSLKAEIKQMQRTIDTKLSKIDKTLAEVCPYLLRGCDD